MIMKQDASSLMSFVRAFFKVCLFTPTIFRWGQDTIFFGAMGIMRA